ncbi:MAG: oxidoreductase, partial [Prolixibacteraceae bacterium]|nr:oxidoreductase [Prolixibacteraceae bacterium]
MKFQARISEIKFYTDSVFVIRFERNGFQFKAGQYLVLSVPGIQESREYSICSGINEPWLEVLVREIPDGYFSKQLKKLEPGDVIYFDGPFGFFILNNIEIKTGEYVFIATGTGISPFISFLKSYPEINYHLVHGIRSYDENYGKDYFPLLH